MERGGQSTDRRSRAQMILVAALLLAVTLVSLSLILNSVIYSENLASRQGVDSDQPLNFRESTRDAAAGSLNSVNIDELDASLTARRDSLRANMSSWRPGRFFAADGLDARAELSGTTEGTRVGQPEFGPLQPNDGSAVGDVDALLSNLDPLSGLTEPISGTQPSWVMADDANLRQFQLDVNQQVNLADIDDLAGVADLEAKIGGTTSPFWLQVEDDDGDRWFIFVYDDPDTAGTEVAQYYIPDNVVDIDGDGLVTINDGTWNTTSACTGDGQVTLDLTGGRLIENTGSGAGTEVPCEGLDAFEKATGTPTVAVVNGGTIDARNRLVADSTESTFRSDVEDANNNLLNLGGLTTTESTFYGDDSDPNDDGVRDEPYTDPALWSADVQVNFRQGPDRIRYSSTIGVTPGLPGEESGVAGGGGQIDSDNQAPDASFSFTPSTPDVGTTVDFDATASSDSDGSIQSYEWSFGDGATASGSSRTNPSHSYGSSGTYDVSLTVTDDDGATTTETKTITVESSSSNDPSKVNFAVSDDSNPGQGPRFDVDWKVEDSDGDLNKVVVKLIDTDTGATDDQSEVSVSGTEASGTANNLDGKHGGCGETDAYRIELLARDDPASSNFHTVAQTTVTPSC